MNSVGSQISEFSTVWKSFLKLQKEGENMVWRTEYVGEYWALIMYNSETHAHLHVTGHNLYAFTKVLKMIFDGKNQIKTSCSKVDTLN